MSISTQRDEFPDNLELEDEYLQQIEAATSKLFQLDDILNEICTEIQEKLEFDFATIQLIRPEENIIEAVCGTGVAKKWTGKARHYLEKVQNLRDIQADIAQTCYTEIIAGWDENGRFDEWVYREFGHGEFARIFAPIILVQDNAGQNNKDWFENLKWRYVKNEQGQEINHENPGWYSDPERRSPKENGQHVAIELLLPEFYSTEENFIVTVIGTIEVGYTKACEHEPIPVGKAVDLIKCISEKALDIRRRQLPCVLDKITNLAREISGADGASLHFLPSLEERYCNHRINSDGSLVQFCRTRHPDQILYIYEEFSGIIGRQFLRKMPPRGSDGLGREAIEAGKPLFFPDYSKRHGDDILKTLNPQIYEEGIRAIAIFPLIFKGLIERFKCEGVLYIHFTTKHRFYDSEIWAWKKFADRAENAIGKAFIYEHQRDTNSQLLTLHAVANSLITRSRKGKDLVRYIAWNALNILSADTVTIYNYIQSENQFLVNPSIAGKFSNTEKAQEEIDETDVPFLLIKSCRNVFWADRDYLNIFSKSIESGFCKREEIKSSAGILLRTSDQIVGVMLIGYRRHHEFSKNERESIIETLASSAAVAIYNQRWLDFLHEIDRKIITSFDLEEVLDLIVRKARQITMADLVDIRLLDNPISEELVMKAWYPPNETNASAIHLRIGEGITGHVAKYRETILVPDVQRDPRYIACFHQSASELCVPLLVDHQVLGVLNLESYRIRAFEERHKPDMITLAGQAVIAIQNHRNKEQFIADANIVTIGNIAGSLIHQMNNNFGAIEVYADDILETGDKYSQSVAANIKSIIDQAYANAEHLENWIPEKPQPVDVVHTIIETLQRISFPRNIIQEIEIQKDLPTIPGSEKQLSEVFRNLIQNALDAMPNGGKLGIIGRSIVREEQCWIEVEVSDTGQGIQEENYENIFHLKYSTKVGHQGFGLWWTRFYIQRLGGFIALTSHPGDGARFTVRVPVKYQGKS